MCYILYGAVNKEINVKTMNGLQQNIPIISDPAPVMM